MEPRRSTKNSYVSVVYTGLHYWVPCQYNSVLLQTMKNPSLIDLTIPTILEVDKTHLLAWNRFYLLIMWCAKATEPSGTYTYRNRELKFRQ